jgi:3-methyl-2-oxobutanoate hydroxymethyltransferase
MSTPALTIPAQKRNPMNERPSVYDLQQLRGVRQLTQVHVMSVEEAAACSEASIDIVGTDVGPTLRSIVSAAPTSFIQCGIPHGSSPSEALRTALDTLDAGAGAIYTSAGLGIVEALAAEGVPVVGHIGLIPDRATWTNFRAIGKTLDEARGLYDAMKALENAGAFAVEIEVVPPHVATELTRRTRLVTMSMGSGSGCNTQYLFSDDILGENTGHVPRHAKVYDNFAERRHQLHVARVAAFRAYRDDVAQGHFPTDGVLVPLADEVRADFDAYLATFD